MLGGRTEGGGGGGWGPGTYKLLEGIEENSISLTTGHCPPGKSRISLPILLPANISSLATSLSWST